ncbi:Major Facilitator Superfamily protein [Actinomyces ruminicola]|uniref:Major Facilitator Superfamily protein n=1 Tax=Actinomyces ruminicola TaxID=332524 RepID=A0A1H0BXN5_9ACTO|nr:MFS transporter [Actinomyces ruminicola]SDN50347.1 Major Facilitator Superfamily protein [Actinomyces ruminicola]
MSSPDSDPLAVPDAGDPGAVGDGATPTAPAPSLRALATTPVGHLAASMLMVELLAGMQTYINQTVLPLVATDLGARAHYGLVTAAAMVPTFLTMPLGGSMLTRWRADRLMTALTAVLVAGAVTGALAPNVGVYVVGEVLRGLAAGALATVTMGVLVAGLPEAWRRLFLAAGSATWVVSSILGPGYAAAVSQAWGWRWALVVYVPLLVVARLVMAREIRGLHVSDDESHPPLVPALVMAAGVAAIGAVPAASALFAPVGAAGTAAVVWACARVFPTGTMRLLPGRRAALATLAWLCAAYFTLDYLVSPAAHDVLGLGPTAIGWALTCAGLAWSSIAIWTAAHPAREPHRYRMRVGVGGACLAIGGAVLTAAFGGAAPWWGLHVGFATAGAGMGIIHQDTMIRCVTAPEDLGGAPDGISQARAATSATVANAAGAAALGTLATTFVAPSAAGVQANLLVPTTAVLTLALALTPLLARRAA